MTHDDHDVQLDTLFRTAIEGVLFIQQDGLLTRLNFAAAIMLEFTPDEVLNRHIDVLFAPHPDLLHLCRTPGEQQIVIPLSNERIALGTGSDILNGGRVVQLHDITERFALDSRREALVRQIAHDFRNPINAVIAYADLVSHFGELNPKQEKFLMRVNQTARKLYDLAETLVDLAWIETGMILMHRPFELTSLIHEATSELAEEAREHDVTIVYSIQDPVPTVIGDAARIKQVVCCLLKNSVRYSHPHSNIAIHAWQDKAKVYCSVGDQGIGISAEDQEKMWDRMWRSSDERIRAIPGGGIGLTVARAIVEWHGGQIWAESELDVGTVVTFMLPLAEGW